MAKNKFLYGGLLPAVVCLCLLPAGRALSRQQLAFSPAADSFRQRLAGIYRAETGVREASGRNDGKRVAAYLHYTRLPEGHEWCAAFISWCFGQAGRSQPRNPWSPALFPAARLIWRAGQPQAATIQQGDVFGIYNNNRGRIDHVGFIDGREGDWWITVEGNAGNAVRRLRRHRLTLYRIADWVRP